jgi:hypothetical protein
MILHFTEVVAMYGYELTEDCILNLADLVAQWSEAEPRENLKFSAKETKEEEDTRYERTLALLDHLGDERAKVDKAFQRVVGFFQDMKVPKARDKRQPVDLDSESSSRGKKRSKKNQSEEVHDSQCSGDFPNFSLIIVTASRNDDVPIHRCFVVLKDRTTRWTPRDSFCNDLLPMNCSPIPDSSKCALIMLVEWLQLSTTEEEPSWMMCAAAGYSS